MKTMAESEEKPVAGEGKVGENQMTPPPPPPPMLRKFKGKKVMMTKSITKREIEKYWRNKHMEEEDHLFSAIKAAARIRARNLTEEAYKRFEESLKETEFIDDEDDLEMNEENKDKDEYSEESKVGIKDWWTKSKYAYLNQPATGRSKRASSYIPNNCFCKISVSAPGHTAAYLGVF